jgi:uncharacterized protein (TIGR00288 family)
MTQPQHSYLARTHKEPPAHAPNAALLIDFDNVTMAIRSDLQTELKRLLQSEIIRGKVAVQRAYADWRRYPQYIVPLSESSIDLIFAPAHGANKKNATDIRLAIDALELVFTRPEIGTFILLSGDSDFSSLVLKLKEYGKYIIGVGIRESSSDLLIQNCDEYYSYNELAGFTKESEVTHARRDPWELVVEAVKQMTAHNDVMRSDRLKQVMQEIDPSFTEKDVGFSRFSKFVLEAAHRGLITLTKLDNGQYELALGPDVAGAAAHPSLRTAAGQEQSAPPPRERSAGGEGRSRRTAGGDSGGGGGRGFSLGEAFGLLKQALGRLGASDRSVSADQLRDAMIEIKGGEAGPLEPERFPKLLRQAQDAEIIDLSKVDDGAYAVKLRSGGGTEPQAPSQDESKSSEDAAAAAQSSSDPAPAVSPAAGVPIRSARFRRGSKGPRVAAPDIPKIGVVEVDPNFKPRIELVPASRPITEIPSSSSAPPREESREPRRGGRGSTGGGGDRSRRGSGGGGQGGGGRSSSSGRERGEREPGERGRGRRGGRGRGGSRTSESSGFERAEPREVPIVRPVPVATAPPPSSPPPPSEQDSGESFWTKVKRGLTGGT